MLMRSSSVTDGGKEGESKPSGTGTAVGSTADTLIGKLKGSRGMLRGLERVGDAGTVKSSVETVKDQIRYEDVIGNVQGKLACVT